MDLIPQKNIQERLKRWAVYLACAVFLVGLLSLAGWMFHMPLLKRPVPGLVAMNPLTALSFIFCAWSLLILTRESSQLKKTVSLCLAVSIVFVGTVKLLAIAEVISFQIDHYIFSLQLDQDLADGQKNKMAPNTALSLVLSGFAMLLMNTRTNYQYKLSSQFVALAILMISFFSLLGYLYGVQGLYDVSAYFPMAIYSAVCFLFVALAILFIDPDKGFMQQITSVHTGSYLSRVFLPAAFLVPSLIASLRVWGQQAGFYNLEFGTALLITSMIITFIALIWYNTVLLNKRDLQRIESEKQTAYLATLVEQTNDAIISTDANICIQSWNKAAENIYGFKLEDIKGKRIGEFLKSNLTEEQARVSLSELNEKGYFRDEYVFYNRQQQEINVQATVTALKDNNGNINGYVAVHRDITDRKKLEQKLLQLNENLEAQVKEKTAELRNIFERVSDAFIALNNQWEFVYVNKRAEKMFHLTDENFTGKSFFELFPNASNEFMVLFQKALHTQEYVYAELFGSIFNNWFEIHIYPSATGLSVYMRDITERKNAETELQSSYEQIRELSAHVQNIREEERATIAREIHDDLGQQITVMKMDVSWLNKRMSTTTDPLIKQKLADLLLLLDTAIFSIRRIATELRPSILDDLGLLPAIEWHLDNFEKKSGVKTHFKESVANLYLTNNIKTTVFRIFQESLTNIVRHADASNVKVVLEQGDNFFTLRIEDDGKGFDNNEQNGIRTLGLLGMKERAAMINGFFHIESKPGSGTKVLVTVPVNTND